MLTLSKHYAEAQVDINLQNLHYKVRNIHHVDDHFVAFSEGILYVFQRKKALLYATSTMDFTTAGRKILLATGTLPSWKTTMMTFETSFCMNGSSPDDMLFLDLVHDAICKDLPNGTKMNIFEPGLYNNLVVNLCPFRDGFRVTFHMKPTGKCLVLCDAKPCASNILATTFSTRVRHAMTSFPDSITWDV